MRLMATCWAVQLAALCLHLHLAGAAPPAESEVSSGSVTVTAAAAAVATRVAEQRVTYESSRARCIHGDAGVLVHLLEDADALAYRAELEAAALPEHRRVNVFSHVSTRQRVVSLRAFHPDTLTSAMGHPKTRRVEANCVVKRSKLPPVHPRGGDASLFSADYTDGRNCAHSITVQPGFVDGNVVAVVTHSFPRGLEKDPAKSCVGAGKGEDKEGKEEEGEGEAVDETRQATGLIEMRSDLVGTLKIVLPHALITGTYKVDGQARLEDSIEWEATVMPKEKSDGDEEEEEEDGGSGDGDDGGSSEGKETFPAWVKVWTRVATPAYDKTTAIGPLEEGGEEGGEEAKARRRNPHASTRWNWGLDRIDQKGTHLDDTYQYGEATGEGTRLYGLDTGVFIGHNDFGARAVKGISVRCRTGEELDCLEKWAAYEGVIDDAVLARDPTNQRGCDLHGTHTASTAIGRLYGVASKAELVAVQALDCNGEGTEIDVAAAIEWVIDHARDHADPRPSVISLSLGTPEPSEVMGKAVAAATAAGILTIVAAGNDGGEACAQAPAAYPAALTVGATGLIEPLVSHGKPIDAQQPHKLYDQRANFSDKGTCVDVFAPGVEILAAIPVYQSPNATAILSGTSMAAPIVAGVALQILGLYPHFKPDDVRRAIDCASLRGAIRGLDPYTHNRLVQGGKRLLRPKMRRLIERQGAPAGQVWDATQCHRVFDDDDDDNNGEEEEEEEEETPPPQPDAEPVGMARKRGVGQGPHVLMAT